MPKLNAPNVATHKALAYSQSLLLSSRMAILPESIATKNDFGHYTNHWAEKDSLIPLFGLLGSLRISRGTLFMSVRFFKWPAAGFTAGCLSYFRSPFKFNRA